MHTGRLVVGCWFLVLVWISFFYIHSSPLHTEHSQWIGALLDAGVQQSLSSGSEPLHKARGCSVCDPCIASALGEPGCGHVQEQGRDWAASWQRTAALEPSVYFLTLDNIKIKRNLSFAPQVI